MYHKGQRGGGYPNLSGSKTKTHITIHRHQAHRSYYLLCSLPNPEYVLVLLVLRNCCSLFSFVMKGMKTFGLHCISVYKDIYLVQDQVDEKTEC